MGYTQSRIMEGISIIRTKRKVDGREVDTIVHKKTIEQEDNKNRENKEVLLKMRKKSWAKIS